MALQKQYHKLLDKHHSQLRVKINPIEIFYDIEELTDFDKEEIKFAYQRGPYEGYDKLKDVIEKRSIKAFHNFISALKKHNYGHFDIVDEYDIITKSQRRFRNLFSIVSFVVMILSGIITIYLFLPTDTQEEKVIRNTFSLMDKGNTIECVCSNLNDVEYLEHSQKHWKIKNFPLSTKENIDSIFNEDMEPPWKQLSRIMQKPAFLVNYFEKSECPAGRFLMHVSESDNMTLSKLIPYLLEIDNKNLVDLINANADEKERVISDINGSVLWEIEIALNTASQPPWLPLAKKQNLSYGEISDIAKTKYPASMFEEIDEMTFPELVKYFKSFCGSRDTIYKTKIEKDDVTNQTLPTFSFHPMNFSEYVCELNTTDALKQHIKTLDLKIESMSYSQSKVYYELLNQKVLPAWMLIARALSLSMTRIQKIGESKNPGRELMLYLNGDCHMTLTKLKPYLLSVGQMWSYRVISEIEDSQQDKRIYDVKSKYIWEIEQRLNIRPKPILHNMAIEQGLTYGEIHEIDLAANPAQKLKNVRKMTGRDVIKYVRKYCNQEN